jgi:hypothetical protein
VIGHHGNLTSISLVSTQLKIKVTVARRQFQKHLSTFRDFVYLLCGNTGQQEKTVRSVVFTGAKTFKKYFSYNFVTSNCEP